MSIICSKRSTTLFEIIVAILVFSLVMAGMVSVFVAGKRHVLHSQKNVTSSEMAKLFLDYLQLEVRQDTWDTPSNGLNLSVAETFTYCDEIGGHTKNPACPSVETQRKVSNTDYTAEYSVAAISGIWLRRVRVKVHWDEPTT